MPTYDYKCNDCEHIFEEFHKITEDPEIFCPKCGAKSRRLISGGAGIVFKGSGFYVNDYKKSSPNNSENKNDNIANDNTSTEAKTKDTAKTDSTKSNNSKTTTESP